MLSATTKSWRWQPADRFYTTRLQSNDAYPERFCHQLKWLESCVRRGIRVLGQGATLEVGFAFTFKD
jgi:hypothetical protein